MFVHGSGVLVKDAVGSAVDDAVAIAVEDDVDKTVAVRPTVLVVAVLVNGGEGHTPPMLDPRKRRWFGLAVAYTHEQGKIFIAYNGWSDSHTRMSQ